MLSDLFPLLPAGSYHVFFFSVKEDFPLPGTSLMYVYVFIEDFMSAMGFPAFCFNRGDIVNECTPPAVSRIWMSISAFL